MSGKQLKVNRRDFVLTSAKLAVASMVIPWSNKVLANIKLSNPGELSILQGATSETTTQFSIDLPKNAAVRFQVVDELGGVLHPERVTSERRDHSQWRVDQAVFVNLIKNRQYQLQVVGADGELADYRQFSTLDMSKLNPKIAFMSCMRAASSSIEKMWRGVKIHKPDLIFFMGDNCYGDRGGNGPAHLWENYIDTRQEVNFYHYYNLIPVLATWDDHDYGLNNAEGNYQHKEDSYNTFRTFFAQDDIFASNLRSGPGVASAYSAFGNQFYLFDGRSYRDSNAGVMMGPQQLEWFAAQRGTFATGPVWLINGSQFFAAYAEKESYEYQAPGEMAHFLNEVSRWSDPATFVAGDRHFSEIMDLESSILGYDAVELTSSSMHSITRPFGGGRNPRRRSDHRFKNFMLLTLDTQAAGLKANLKVISKKGKVKHEDTIEATTRLSMAA